MKKLALVFGFVGMFTIAYTQDSLKTWKSEHRDLEFQYKRPWTLLPALDVDSRTSVGVIDYGDGKSCIIQFFDDMPKDQLSDSLYFDGLKQKMLKANSKNKLLIEDEVVFHGHKAQRHVYIMFTARWGVLKMFTYIIRTGKEAITVQMSFPADAADERTDFIPSQLTEFDKMVKLNGQ